MRTTREIVELFKSDPGSLTPAELRFVRNEIDRKNEETSKQSGKKSLGDAAKDLGVSKSLLSKQSKKYPDFPVHYDEKGSYHLTEEIRAWQAIHCPPAGGAKRGPKKRSEFGPPGAAYHPPAPTPILRDDDPILSELRSGDALRINRAAVKLAGLQIATGATQGKIGPTAFDDLKKQLAELRQAIDDDLTQRERAGKLMQLETVWMVVERMWGKIVKCFDKMENAIGTEYEVMIGDPAFAELSSDARRAKWREAVRRFGGEIRTMEADELHAMIEKEAKADE